MCSYLYVELCTTSYITFLIICPVLQKGGGTIDLEPCLTHSSTLEPTLAPVAVERTMTTRAAASVLFHLSRSSFCFLNLLVLCDKNQLLTFLLW